MARNSRKPSPGQMPLTFQEVDEGLSDHDAYWLAEAEKQPSGSGLRAASRELRAIELIAAITDLGHEKAEAIMKKAGGLHRLARMPDYVLQTLPAMNKENAEKIHALTEWALLLNEADKVPTAQISTPEDIANLVMLEMGLLEKEELRVIGLDTKNHVMGIETVYRGSVNTTVLRVGEVMRMPITLQCTSMVLVHNHPSAGELAPSPEDVRVTGMIAEAARQLDINLMDHLIVNGNRFISMRSKGLGF